MMAPSVFLNLSAIALFLQMEPIITKFFELVLTGSIMDLGKRFTEVAIAKIASLRQFIITRLQGKPKAKEAHRSESLNYKQVLPKH